MEQYVIRGGNPLVGEVEIGGAKNAALAILTAANAALLPQAKASENTTKVVAFKKQAATSGDTRSPNDGFNLAVIFYPCRRYQAIAL